MVLMEANSIDAIVTDPPYGLSFMGKNWDCGVPGKAFWQEALRVAKPGAHLLAFGGTRTFHRLTCAIEDAGWEIRDCIMWVYSSGFPKSHNLKGQWNGWGTALKPAWEPVIMARKPLKNTVAANVLKYSTGAINIDGCRVGALTFGRWPANFTHDGSDEVMGLFPQAASSTCGVRDPNGTMGYHGGASGLPGVVSGYADTGSAARFFYCSKATQRDRDEGLDEFEEKQAKRTLKGKDSRGRPIPRNKNIHPTVKPINLMRYLCRLVTPLSGVVLDPFMGSGSTGKAAILEGFKFVGIELEEEYLRIAEARIKHATYAPQKLF
jgi:site-specific DNA-methyltransferase (adenine-specific)